ncbi:MAG: hypothetical protein QXI42_07715 [Thermoproteota archaeon]|nr:hypothetical protein [Candidatus Brockarchaeota archaeon]
MVGRAWRGLLLTLFSSTVFSLLLLLGLNPSLKRARYTSTSFKCGASVYEPGEA